MPSAMDLSNIHGITDWTEQVNRIDNMYDFTGQIANFVSRNTNSTNITFDLTDKNVIIPQSSQRGVKNFTKGREKTVKPVSIFLDYIREDDNITKNDFLDYRLPGTADQMDTLTAVRMDKLTGLQNNVTQAIEYQKLSAMTGVSKTAYGDTLFDGYAVTGNTQQSVDFLLGTNTTKVGLKLDQAVQLSASKYRTGAIMPSPIAIVGDTFFDNLITHASVEQAYEQYASSQEPLRNTQVQMQRFGSIRRFFYKSIWIYNYNPIFNILDTTESNFTTTTTKVIADNEGYLLPSVAPDFLRSYWGPSQKLTKEGGMPLHASEYLSNDEETWNMTVESAGLHFCTNPDAIVKLTTSN